MNRLASLLLLTIFGTFAVSATCQVKSTAHRTDEKTKELIIGLEKKTWELTREKNGAALADFIADEGQDVGELGIWDKEKSVDLSDPGYVLTGFSLDHFHFVRLSPAVVLLTYEAKQTGTQDGKPLRSPLFMSSVWVSRGGKWLQVLFQDTPAAATASSNETNLRARSDSFFLDKEKEVWEAIKNKDKAADSRLLADDFIGLYDTGLATRSDHVKQMDDNYSVESYNLQDTKVLHLSPTMALLLYKATCQGSGEWAEFCSRPEYISSLWAERDGQWLALFSQDSIAASGKQERELSAQALAKEKEILETLKRNDWPAFADLLSDDAVLLMKTESSGRKN